MSTSNLKARYFVKSDFREQYPKGSDARRRVEDSVEQKYLDALRTNCYQEHVNSKGCVVVCGRILNYLLLESQRKGMFGCSFLQISTSNSETTVLLMTNAFRSSWLTRVRIEQQHAVNRAVEGLL